MIRLTCTESSTDDLPFNIVEGQDYEPLDCKEMDGVQYYLIHKTQFFGYWYEERMFRAVQHSDAELDEYVKEAQQYTFTNPLNIV